MGRLRRAMKAAAAAPPDTQDLGETTRGATVRLVASRRRRRIVPAASSPSLQTDPFPGKSRGIEGIVHAESSDRHGPWHCCILPELGPPEHVHSVASSFQGHLSSSDDCRTNSWTYLTTYRGSRNSLRVNACQITPILHQNKPTHVMIHSMVEQNCHS